MLFMISKFNMGNEVYTFVLTFVLSALLLWIIFKPLITTIIWVSILLAFVNIISRLVVRNFIFNKS